MDDGPALAKLKSYAISEAYRLGFVASGFASAKASPTAGNALRAFVAAGRHGDMAWMAETLDRRADPQVLWPEAKSILALGFNYGPDEDPRLANGDGGVGAISVYARGRDYHDVIKGKLKELAGRIGKRSRELKLDVEAKVFVDTAPVMEKPIAQKAGLGWQGKHTNLVSRQFGSWLFLAEIFFNIEFLIDDPEIDHCGSCRNCLDACPTNAFPTPYTLDARRCISYLTIEHQGPIPREFRRAIGNRIYGCDDCLAVCPWNKFASESRELKLSARDDLRAPAVCDLLLLNDTDFRKLFAGSPIKRIGRNRFIRNVLIAAGNGADEKAQLRILLLLNDGSALVRGAAVWALGECLGTEEFAALKARLMPRETDPEVLDEWALVGVQDWDEARVHARARLDGSGSIE